MANYGGGVGVRTRYTRQLIGGSWWHYRPPRKHNLGGREDVKAHSPRALLLFWHGAAAAAAQWFHMTETRQKIYLQ